MLKRVSKSVYGFFKDMSVHNSAAYASSIAFFFSLSFIPTMMFTFSLLKYLPLNPSDIINMIDDFLPASLMAPVDNIILQIYNSSISLLPITVIFTLWTANMGMLGLIRGLNGILGLPDKRNYFLLRAIATVYTLFMLTGLLSSLVMIVFGKKIVNGILVHIHNFSAISSVLNRLLLFRSLIIFAILTIVFALVYTFLPAKRQSFILSLPGAMLASIGWCLVTFVFSIYVDYFNGFSIYGNLTFIMVFLFWMYTCFSLLIMGAFLNKYYKNSIERKLVLLKLNRENKREKKKAIKNQKAQITR